MKITVTFEVPTPADALAIFGALKRWIMYEYNPGEWKAPSTHTLTLTEHRISAQVEVKLE